jgi:hypothetical protein|tara:strand:+ start:340 stop:603 length:264 start_codon:yes stop_codon:yes gene_type:complete
MTTTIPTRKISETILEFGDPLISILPDGFTKEEFEGIIMTIVAAWNSVVLDDWKKSDNFTTEYRKAMSQMDNPIAPVILHTWQDSLS